MSSIVADRSFSPERENSAQVQTRASVTWTLEAAVCWLLVVGVVFVNGADFRGSTGGEFEVHWQIYLRLLISLACGAVGLLLLLPRTYRDFLALPGLIVAADTLWYAATIPISSNRIYSAAAWVSLACVILFVPAAMRVLGGLRTLLAIASGLSLYLIGSWVAYLFFPDIGVFQEQVTQTAVYERMGGLGHPNELGFYAAYTVLLFSGLARAKKVTWVVALPMVLLGGATLITCFSRTALIACVVGLIFLFARSIFQRGNVIAMLGLALAGLAVVFVAFGLGELDWYLESLLVRITKSGSTEELATATGRTEIWAYALEQIAASPLVGYGYCSLRFVMEEQSYHAHNIVLNATLCGGLLSGFLLLLLMVYLLAQVFFRPSPAIDGLVICMLVGGAVDGLLGAPSPAASIMIWYVALFWRQLRMNLTPEETVNEAGADLLRPSLGVRSLGKV